MNDPATNDDLQAVLRKNAETTAAIETLRQSIATSETKVSDAEASISQADTYLADIARQRAELDRKEHGVVRWRAHVMKLREIHRDRIINDRREARALEDYNSGADE